MNQKEKLIYLAGIIDGEGCIKVHRHYTRKHFSRQARFTITNTSKELIDWLYENFRGYKYQVVRTGNRKLQYIWRLRVEEMRRILPKIIPYLIVKKEEAEESLELLKITRKRNNYRVL